MPGNADTSDSNDPRFEASSEDLNTKLSNAHDRFVRDMFNSPEALVDQLQAALPAAIADMLDFGSVTMVKGSFVDRFHAWETDLLVKVSYRDNPNASAYAYVLVEHQSTVDPGMPPRMLGYLHRVWAHLVNQNQATWDNLPAVIPLVYYHGSQKWDSPTTIKDCIDEAGQPLAGYGPQLSLLVDDISHTNLDKLLARHTSPAMRVVSTLLVHRSNVSQLLNALTELTTDLVKLTDREQILIVMYLKDQTGAASVDELLTIAKHRNPQLEHIMTTYYEEAIESLRREGLQKGLEQGRLAGMRRALLVQATAKFGPVSSEHKALIDQATDTQLEHWQLTILTAPTANAMFDPEQN